MNLWKDNGRIFTVISLIGFALSLNVSNIKCQACGSTPETEGTFGVNCSQVCTCSAYSVCDNITGQCSGSFCGMKNALACDKNDLHVVVIPSIRIAKETTTLNVTCIVNLTPEDITVSWRNPRGIDVTPDEKYEITRISETVYDLTVSNAGPEDSGSYTCNATLNQPTADLTFVQESTKITVVSQGKIFEFPTSSVVKKLPGQYLQLTCKAFFESGFQQQSLQWTWSEGAIDFSEPLKIEFFGTTDVILTRTLKFSNLTGSRSGTYACSASENGTDESDRREVNVFIVESAEISDLRMSSKTQSSLLLIWSVVNTGNDILLCTAHYCSREECLPFHCMNETSCNITGLSIYSTYNVSVLCENYAGFSNELEFFGAKTSAAAPDSVPDLELAGVTDTVTTSSITLIAPNVDDRNGPISCYEFVVLEAGIGDTGGDPDHDYPFNSVQEKPLNKSLPYRAVVLTAQELENTSTITLGGEDVSSSTCNLSQAHSRRKRNGQLPPDVSILKASNDALRGGTDYKVFMRVYVGLQSGNSIYVSSRYLEVTTTKDGGIASIIVIILAVVGVTAFLFLIWIIRRRHRVRKKTIKHNDDEMGGYANQGFVAGTSSYLSLQSMKPTEYQSRSSYLSLKPTVTGVNAIQTSREASDISRQQPATDSDIQPYLEMNSNRSKPPCEDDGADILSHGNTDTREDEDEDYTTPTGELRNSAIEDAEQSIEGEVESEVEEEYEKIPNDIDDGYSRVLYEKLHAPVPFPVSELSAYIERRKGPGPKSLATEFGNLPKGQQEPWTVAIKEENSSKNPFPKILPYDHTRVKLAKLSNDSSSDYYNASFITDQFNKTAFIAAQGPCSSTVEDFWRMVWQEKIEVIVMVTNLAEEDKQLCVQYWPNDTGVTESYGDISVKLHSTESFPDYQIRYMNIQKENERSVEVTQFQYLSWPHLEVPINTSSLLSFLKLVKEGQNNLQIPPLVHCSDGAGATGTFLALYCLLDDLLEGNEICVYDFVKKMRKNRVNMIQTKTQYVYVYNALLEAYLTPQSELSAEALDGMEITSNILSEEFQVLRKLPTNFLKMEKGALEDNKLKNRFSDIIPADQWRPVLSSKSLMSGSDYINATFANSFFEKNAYILTQSPLPTTVEDFWRLVYDYQCRKIVMLNSTESSNKTLICYWPRGGAVQYGSMMVENIGAETLEDGFIQRRFSVSHIDNLDVRYVTQIHLNSWDTDDPAKLGEFFKTIEDHEENPTLVHCLDGCTHSGIFVTVQCEMQHYRHTGRINVFNRVRELGTTNPYTVRRVEDYALCYKILKYMTKVERNG